METKHLRTLVLEGTGTVSKQPEIMVFHTDLVHVKPTYKEAIEALRAHYEAYLDVFEEHGFDIDLIQTSSVDVFVVEKTDKQERAVRVSQSLFFETAINLDRMALLLDGFKAHDSFNFSLSYKLKDPQKAQEEALDAAIQNAKALATRICESAGVQLLDIEQIEYGDLGNEPVMMRAMADFSSGMTPKNLSVSQTIRIRWRIQP